MSTQHQRRSLSDAWPIAEYLDKPRNIYIPRPEHNTAINLPVSRETPSEELLQFAVREGDVWIHPWDLFVRASDNRCVMMMKLRETTSHAIVETMYRMFVPRDYPEEDFLPGDVLVPMIPYKDTESQENVAVITTMRFNSLTGLHTVFVAPIDSEGRVDIARTRACLKSVLTPVEGPEVQKREAIRDIHGFFLQGITPSAVTIDLPNLRMRQEREPYDERYKVVKKFGEILDEKEVDDRTLLKKLRDLSTTSDEQGGNGAPTQGGAFQNTSRTDDAMLEHEGHLSQQGQMRERASRATAGNGGICLEDHTDPPVMRRAVERDLCAVGVLRHFRKTKLTFGTHIRMCPLCQAKAGRLFHAAICRASNCQRCNRVAEGVARHMGRCDDHSCPICAAVSGIPLFVPGRFEPTVVFVSLVR